MWIAPICVLLLAATPELPKSPADGRALRASLRSVERAIDDRVQRMTSRQPFVLLGATRSAYLAGYGAVFTLEVNLVPTANISPFRPAYSPQEIKDLNRRKREKVGEFKTAFRQLLVDQAGALSQVPPNEKIAIAVTLFNFHWEDTTGLPSQLVFSATRQTLLDLASRRASPEAADRAIELREF